MVIVTLRCYFVYLIALSNRNSLSFDQLPLNVTALIIAVMAAYLIYSVLRYFGLERALGADHFDPSYRDRHLVKQGIYRFVNNRMYLFGVTIIWIPGLVYASNSALLAALFNHRYICVHYYCTEKPDMKRIYTVD